jgi:hypothetical protein
MPVTPRAELLEGDEHAGRLECGGDEQERGRCFLEARVSCRNHRQCDRGQAGSQGYDNPRRGAHLVPLKRDEHADAGEDEDSTEIAQHPHEHTSAFDATRRRLSERVGDVARGNPVLPRQCDDVLEGARAILHVSVLLR